MKTRRSAGLRLALAVVWLAVGLSVTLPLTAGEDTPAPWAAVAAQCAQARADYLAALKAVDAKYTQAQGKEDPAAIMQYLAARKAPQDAYRQALAAAAATAVPLQEGVDWHPAAAALAQEWVSDGQFEKAAAAYDQALLPPWKAGADPEKFKAFREFLAALPPDQKAYLACHQAWCCYRLGTLHERAGTPKLAVTLYRNALSLERRPRFLVALALASTLHSDYEQARALLVEASAASLQANALIEYNLGYCLEKLWQLDAAAAAYDRAGDIARNRAKQNQAVAPTDGLPFGDKDDSLGIKLESYPRSRPGSILAGMESKAVAPLAWDLDVPVAQAEEAARRVRQTAAALTVGQKDAVRKAYDLFQQASKLNEQDLAEKWRDLHPVARNFEEEKLLADYERLMSQAVVAFPRFVPALVKEGIIKINLKQTDQALILFQSALEADREDPAALIYYAQTALQAAGQDIEALEQALTPATPAQAGQPVAKPDLPALQQRLDRAIGLLKPLPEIGKRLAARLDKHAIGYEICALAEWEQVHANSFRQKRDAAGDQTLLTQAHRDYLQARRRGGHAIDLFEKPNPDAPDQPAAH